MFVAILAAALAVAVKADSNCDAAYQCKYFFDAGTSLWKWDFTPSCINGAEYTYRIPNRTDLTTYHMQLCGVAKTTCPPGSPYTEGAVVQTMTGDGCVVVGTGPPIFSPWAIGELDAPRGLNVTFKGEPPLAGQTTCQFDPSTGTFSYRHAVFQLRCDYSALGLVVDAVVESPECFYNIMGRSIYACPTTCNDLQ